GPAQGGGGGADGDRRGGQDGPAAQRPDGSGAAPRPLGPQRPGPGPGGEIPHRLGGRGEPGDDPARAGSTPGRGAAPGLTKAVAEAGLAVTRRRDGTKESEMAPRPSRTRYASSARASRLPFAGRCGSGAGGSRAVGRQRGPAPAAQGESGAGRGRRAV